MNIKEAVKQAIVPKAKEVVVEEVVETTKKQGPNIALICLGIGLAIFGIGLLAKKPSVMIVKV